MPTDEPSTTSAHPELVEGPALVLPQFAPVPRAKDRSNGWKPEVQRAFIEALAETGSVKAACRKVGRADHGAYLLRRHPQAEEFRRAWQAALDIGIQRIEDIAMERAINGTEEPVYSYGKLVGTRIRYNDRLLMFMLRNRAPERFAGGKPKALSATDRDTLKKLKAQWREEWEREAATLDAEREHQDGDDFIERIKAMHRAWYLRMSPATRALYRAFREAEDADDGRWLSEGEADAVEAQLDVAEAEYEEWFGKGRDRRAQVAKLVDMRAWPDEGEDEADED